MKKLLGTLLFLALASCPRAIFGQTTFRVLSYNVEDGLHHGERIQEFLDWVKPKKPDLVFLQEMNDFTPEKLAAFAKEYGHSYSVLCKTDNYPVAITSRYPITDVEIVTHPMTHGYILAKVRGYTVLATHLDPFRQPHRVQEINLVLSAIAKLPPNVKLILAGDLNSFNAADGAHMTQNNILRLQEKEREDPRVHNLVNGQPDFSITNGLLKVGLVDAYSLNRGQDQPGYTVNHPLRPNRIDYIWVSPNLVDKVLSCNFIYDDVTAHLSDHHPLFMELEE